MELNIQEIGRRITKRRKSLKLKQEELASMINISNNHLSSIECGKTAMSMDVFCKICTALRVNPDYLLLGSLRSNNVPQNITDSLRLCSERQIAFISNFIEYILTDNSGYFDN